MAAPTVFIVDDDPAVRDSIRLLLKSVGLPLESFASGQEFLGSCDPLRAGCLLLDVRMPGLSGLELLDRLAERGIRLPVIVITGHGDVPMAVRAMKAGALDFLEKPFNDQLLLERINQAFQRDAHGRVEQAQHGERAARLARLTTREREVLDLLVQGKSTRAIAVQLGISAKTVDVHRGKVLNKMESPTLVSLVRMMLG